MASTMMESSQDAHQLAEKLSTSIRSVMVGADDAVSVTVMALLAQGHILVEGAPGVGKTVLGKSLARSISGSFRRIQCTADLLPADITGTNVFDPRDQGVPLPPRADLLARRVGGRDQPRAAAHAVRVPRKPR